MAPEPSKVKFKDIQSHPALYTPCCELDFIRLTQRILVSFFLGNTKLAIQRKSKTRLLSNFGVRRGRSRFLPWELFYSYSYHSLVESGTYYPSYAFLPAYQVAFLYKDKRRYISWFEIKKIIFFHILTGIPQKSCQRCFLHWKYWKNTGQSPRH